MKMNLHQRIARHSTHKRESLYQMPDGDMGCIECDADDCDHAWEEAQLVRTKTGATITTLDYCPKCRTASYTDYRHDITFTASA